MTESAYSINTETRLNWILWFRVVFLAVLAVSALSYQFIEGVGLIPKGLWFVVGAGSLLSLFSWLGLKLLWAEKQVNALCVAQIVIDVVLASFLVKETGGLYSGFTLLYGLNILTSGILLLRWGALLGAVLSSAAFAFLVLGTSFSSLSQNSTEVLRFGFVLSALLAVGFLVSRLFKNREELWRQLQATSSDLEALRGMYQKIVDHIPDAILVVQDSGEIVFANPAANTIFGQSAEGRRLEELSLETVLQEESGRKELKREKEAGKHQSLQVQYLPLEGHGSLVVISDLTAIRQLEEELRFNERLASIGQLAAGLAHEIKNPLASLSGSVQLLEGELPKNESGGKLMQIVLRETDRLDELLMNFLNYAKPSELSLDTVYIRDLVEDVLDLIGNIPTTRAHQIQYEVDIHPSLKCICDESKIRQVFWNLIRNAGEVLNDGGRICIRANKAEGAQLLIEVEDNGRGIPKSSLEKVFEPFYTSGKEGGTGLGLAVTYQIIQAHSGSIGVDSEEGHGTKFWFKLREDGPVTTKQPQSGRTAA